MNMANLSATMVNGLNLMVNIYHGTIQFGKILLMLFKVPCQKSTIEIIFTVNICFDENQNNVTRLLHPNEIPGNKEFIETNVKNEDPNWSMPLAYSQLNPIRKNTHLTCKEW